VVLRDLPECEQSIKLVESHTLKNIFKACSVPGRFSS
jgi:hypothetical protein